jgi:hypothetical protein
MQKAVYGKSSSSIKSVSVKPPKPLDFTKTPQTSSPAQKKANKAASSNQGSQSSLPTAANNRGPSIQQSRIPSPSASRGSVSITPNNKVKLSTTSSAREDLDQMKQIQDDPYARLVSHSPEIEDALQYLESLSQALLECRDLISKDRAILEEVAIKKRYRKSTAGEMAQEKEILNRLELLTDKVSKLIAKRARIQKKLEHVRDECIKITLKDRIVAWLVIYRTKKGLIL